MSDSDTSSNVYKFTTKMVSTRVLIQLVHERPCLWDRHHANYRDKYAKEKAWLEIYREFEPGFESLEPSKRHRICACISKKWYNVRDAYVKSKKSDVRNRPYLYSEELRFLDSVCFLDHSKQKAMKEESFEERVSNDDDGDNEGTSNWINEVFVDIDEGGRNLNNNAKRPKVDYSPSKDVNEFDENIVAVLANLIQKEEDEDRAFFKSITPAVKKLSDSSKFEFRIQVMNLIKTLKLRDKKSVQLKIERVTQVVSDSE